MKTKIYLLQILLLLGLAACGGKPELVVAPEDWVYEDRAITVQVEAPSDLNALSGRPHSLEVALFQLNDPNTFQGLIETTEGAVELLNKGRIDDTVAHFSRIIVQPGESKTTVISRAQSAQFVGVIVGYFGLNPDLDIRLFKIPEKASKRGIVDIALSKLGLVANEAKAVPDKLYLHVLLGRTGSKRIRQLTAEEIRLL